MEDIFHKKALVYAIAKEQSFSKAAQKLFIAQPSLSLMIKTLEEDLGTPLFDRSTKPIRLTEAGEAYVHSAKQIIEIERAFKEYMLALNNLETGTLRIGSNQLLSSLVLPKHISLFMQTYPKVKLSLIDANSLSLENDITNGTLDIVIDNSELSTDLFEQRYLASEYLLLAVPAAFPVNEKCKKYGLTYEDVLANRHTDNPPSVPLEHFTNTPFILMTRSNDTRKQSNAIFQASNFTPKVLLEMDRLTNLYSYVEHGTAATLVSDTLVKNIRGVDQSNIIFYPLPTHYNRRNIYAYYKKNKFCSKAMAAFIDSLGGLL